MEKRTPRFSARPFCSRHLFHHTTFAQLLRLDEKSWSFFVVLSCRSFSCLPFFARLGKWETALHTKLGTNFFKDCDKVFPAHEKARRKKFFFASQKMFILKMRMFWH